MCCPRRRSKGGVVPPVVNNAIQTEAGDDILTEAGDTITTES